jgi:hypothetical protein
MSDPLTLAVAAAAAGKAVELAGQPVKDGVAAFGRMLRARFGGRAAEEQVLSSAIAEPDDGTRVGRLAGILDEAMTADPAFADDLKSVFRRAVEEDPEFGALVDTRLQRVRVDATANDEGVTNVFNGTAEKVIQLRDVHGGLTIN